MTGNDEFFGERLLIVGIGKPDQVIPRRKAVGVNGYSVLVGRNAVDQSSGETENFQLVYFVASVLKHYFGLIGSGIGIDSESLIGNFQKFDGGSVGIAL